MIDTPDRSDQAVVDEVRAGTSDAFKKLIERHQDRVFNLLVRLVRNHETARDLAQETFLKAYLSLDQYRPEYRFGNWLLKIAQNLAFSYLRRVGVDRERLTLDGEDGPGVEMIADGSPMADPSVLVEEKVLGDLVLKTIDGLAEKYRLVLTLRHTENLSYTEIADVLGIPLGTVKFRLHQAYRLLNEAFCRYGVIDR